MHISALADKFVKDPHDVVKAGDIVKTKVLEIDIARKRIALTMRMSDEPPTAAEAEADERAAGGRPNNSRGAGGQQRGGAKPNRGGQQKSSQPAAAPANNAFAQAFQKAQQKNNKDS